VDFLRVHDQLVLLPQAAQLRRKRQRLRHRHFFVVGTMNHQQRNGDLLRPLHDGSLGERGGASTRIIGNQLHHAVGNAGHALLRRFHQTLQVVDAADHGCGVHRHAARKGQERHHPAA
jgi:hypothetical protein